MRFSFLSALAALLLQTPPLCHGLEPPATVTAASDKEAFSRSQDFYRIFLGAASVVDARFATEFSLNSPEEIARVTREIRLGSRIVPKLCSIGCECESTSLAAKHLPSLEQQLLPAVFRFQLQYGLNPPEEVLRRFYNGNLVHYPQEESVSGAEILVRKSEEGSTAAITETLQAIASRLRSGENFFRVAHDYYTSAGLQTTGNLGRITRRDVPEWKFKLFVQADLREPFFGPVETPEGYMFGKAWDPVTSGLDGFYGAYREQILADYRRETSRHRLRTLLTSQTEALHPNVFPFDPGNSAGPAQTAYEIAGTSVTFADCRTRLPQLFGDARDPRFWNSIARQSLENELILRSPAAETTSASEEYRYLKEAWINALFIQKCIEQKLAAAQPDERQLQEFYEATQEKYRSPDLVTLRVVQLPFTQGAPAKDRPSPTREADFRAARQIRDRYQKDPTTATLASLNAQFPHLVERLLESVPENQLGRILETGIEHLAAHAITPVLPENGGYLFAEVLERKSGQNPPFSDVRQQVRGAWQQTERKRIREELEALAERHS